MKKKNQKTNADEHTYVHLMAAMYTLCGSTVRTYTQKHMDIGVFSSIILYAWPKA